MPQLHFSAFRIFYFRIYTRIYFRFLILNSDFLIVFLDSSGRVNSTGHPSEIPDTHDTPAATAAIIAVRLTVILSSIQVIITITQILNLVKYDLVNYDLTNYSQITNISSLYGRQRAQATYPSSTASSRVQFSLTRFFSSIWLTEGQSGR